MTLECSQSNDEFTRRFTFGGEFDAYLYLPTSLKKSFFSYTKTCPHLCFDADLLYIAKTAPFPLPYIRKKALRVAIPDGDGRPFEEMES